MGYLSILCSKTNRTQELFVVANRPSASSSNLNISVTGIPPDDYTVVVYDLGRNGVPPEVSDDNITTYDLAAGIENVTVADQDGSGDEKESVTIVQENAEDEKEDTDPENAGGNWYLSS